MYVVINRHRALKAGAASLLLVAMCGRLLADEPSTLSQTTSLESFFAEPANWQESADTMPVPPALEETTILRPSPVVVVPADRGVAPLLDDGSCMEDRHTVLGEHLGENYESQRRGVRPYGGGHPTDWPWGCGGSPFRTGPGMCDTYRVGPIWNVAVDGMVMRRGATNIGQIVDETSFIPPDTELPDPDLLEPFDYAPGGRVSLVGKYPPWAGYQVQAAYEGIEAWEASIIYPKQPFDSDLIPVSAEGTRQRRVHYRSNLHSGELNILKCHNNVWQPFCGVRYIKFDDEIRDFIDEEAAGPLPGDPPGLAVTTTDMTNLFDLENNLMGFQVGLRRDFWRVNSRFAIEGFLNGGLYYNKIKYTNLMNTSIRQRTADDIGTEGNEFGDTTVVSQNIATSDVSEIAYVGEASLSGVFRINKCWAARAGYQVLWVNGLRLADDAFLTPPEFTDNESRSMLFQGWHAGIECRR